MKNLNNIENNIKNILINNGIAADKVAMVMTTILSVIQTEACKTHAKVPVFDKQVCVFNGIKQQVQKQVQKQAQIKDYVACSLILDKNIQDFNVELQNRYMNFVAKIYDKYGKTVKIFTNSERIKAICKTAQIVDYKELVTKQYVAAVLESSNKKGVEYIKNHNEKAQIVLIHNEQSKNNDIDNSAIVSIRNAFLNNLEKHSLRKVSVERYDEEIPQLADTEYSKLSKIIIEKSVTTKHKKITLKIVKESIKEYMAQITNVENINNKKTVNKAVKQNTKTEVGNNNKVTEQVKNKGGKNTPAGDFNSCGNQVKHHNTNSTRNISNSKKLSSNKSIANDVNVSEQVQSFNNEDITNKPVVPADEHRDVNDDSSKTTNTVPVKQVPVGNNTKRSLFGLV